MVPLDKVQPNPENPRTHFSETALNQYESIRNPWGVITPLLVRRNPAGDGYILVAGERRLRASGLAGMEEVPVWIRDDIRRFAGAVGTGAHRKHSAGRFRSH